MTNRLAWWITLCSLVALLTLWSAWITVWGGMRHAPLAASLAVATLPLLAGLHGLLRKRRASFIWLGLVSLFYFVHGIVSLYARQPEHSVLAIIETIASLSLFSGAFVWLRKSAH
ncbi:DUF2069 domain-containing protein [Candidatus Methylospira mobilis]|uniref:DUF2069 domain-containing protein n=1 Tax=Candidatus Methylospira mobilis TaxID=1808979 RepID=A0A5Q0BEE2_9GAMM|nr:DUF2069 domain-containing protein [Candidatus Methylospira mobilis]QFY41889.1 DUF2069 domain-containing protein [Candidatus Methylospira mobilis]WNV06768.1 DUF2069 domain-containing protein [Candidatus Methylospira mobilis]